MSSNFGSLQKYCLESFCSEIGGPLEDRLVCLQRQTESCVLNFKNLQLSMMNQFLKSEIESQNLKYRYISSQNNKNKNEGYFGLFFLSFCVCGFLFLDENVQK